MWLTGRLVPDFKTIADFRKITVQRFAKRVDRLLFYADSSNLFSSSVVVIDGSMFKAVNSRDKNLTRGKLKRRMEQINKAIDRYFSQLDCANLDE